jgi:hypothetical protein
VGGRLASYFPQGKRLLVEGAAIAVLIVVGAFLIYHFAVHKIRNTRPLGGANVNITRGDGGQSEASFALDPARPRDLFGASSQLFVYSSTNGGRTWRSEDGPVLREPACPHGEPHAVAGGKAEYLAFLVAPPCGDLLTPYLVTTSRAYTNARWAPVTRVAPPTWQYGFDVAPAIALDQRNGRLYLSWTRSLSAKAAAVVSSSSDDGGHTWSRPVVVDAAADEPHLSTIAVGTRGEVYIAGIDARHGVWIARSTDRGRTFGAVSIAAPLRANPSSSCAGRATFKSLANEGTTCIGPDPTVLPTKTGVAVVYDDVGANGTPDVFVAVLDRELRPRFRAQVNPPDRGKTQQFFPSAAIDRSTGTLWACWYDTMFDPNAHRAWFTCSASHDGRTWTPPERAAAAPTKVADLFIDLQRSTGLSTAVVADRGVAHAFWINIGEVDFAQEIYTAALGERAAFLTLRR